jgi:hypothetical protein
MGIEINTRQAKITPIFVPPPKAVKRWGSRVMVMDSGELRSTRGRR